MHLLNDSFICFVASPQNLSVVDLVAVLGDVPTLHQYGLQHAACCTRLNRHDLLFDRLAIGLEFLRMIIIVMHGHELEIEVIREVLAFIKFAERIF